VLGKVPCREVSYRGTTEKGQVLITTMRVYLVGGRLYQIAAITVPSGVTKPAKVKSLLDSLKLLRN
jgi:hypothetical protein